MAEKSTKDFLKNLEQFKKQLAVWGSKTVEIAQKGEKELLRFSKESKLHIDAATLSVKKEHLYYLIGQEFVRSGARGVKLQKLIKDLKAAEGRARSLKRSIQKARRLR